MKKLVVILASLVMCCGCAYREFRRADGTYASAIIWPWDRSEDLKWESLTFQAKSLNCTGKKWTSSDIVVFSPEIELSVPHGGRIGWHVVGENKYMVHISIMERRTFLGIDWLAPDHEIGWMSAFFRSEDKTPYKVVYPANQQVNRDRGVPDPLEDGFWLVCTRKCKIKGNENKTNESREKIYLYADYIDIETGMAIEGRRGKRRRLGCAK